MALLHAATLVPTKAEMLGGWAPAQPWAPAGGGEVELAGAYRFDDPEGRVGLEVHLVRAGGTLLQVPLTYRDAPLDGDGAAGHLVGTMQHSALGERWVYDGPYDPVFARMLAVAAMSGLGQAVGVVEYGGRWLAVPPAVRLAGGGWPPERVPVDGLAVTADDGDGTVLRNDHLEVRMSRRPVPGPAPAIGLTATWPGQDESVVLATVRDLRPPADA